MKWLFCIFTCFLFTSFAQAKNKSYLLDHSSLLKMGQKGRKAYFKGIGKYILLLEKNKKTSQIDFFKYIFSQAYAAEVPDYRCIGGGVPVPMTAPKCGVSEYAGFRCDNGDEICNPLIFGVLKDGKPICYKKDLIKVYLK